MSPLMTNRAKSSLGGGDNQNPARMNLVHHGGIIEQDGVIGVGDFMAVVVAVTTVDGTERQRQRPTKMEVAVNQTETKKC